MAQSFDRLQAAVVDGRTHNVYYRQQQIESLCKTLLENAEKIRQAIVTDYGHSQSEVAVEFNLALSALRKNYASLQPKKAHEDEYAVANNKDAPDNRVPVGIVCIEPAVHTQFYSTIVPLGAAIAAGNCVIVVLANNLRATSSLLRRLLLTALSADTFAIASDSVKDQNLSEKAVYVAQNGFDVRSPRSNELTSPSRSRTVAVVDRTANIQNSAKELVSTRFSFGGTSPYAPDIILVNEFSKRDFLQAVVNECVRLGSGVEMNGSLGKSSISSKVTEKVDALKMQNKDVRVIVQENNFAVVDLPTRLEKLPGDKNASPVLVVCSMRSLDDAIDLLGRSSSDPYLAAYHFSNPASAKYLSQYVDAAASFVNHVPKELLVGPAFPTGRSINLTERYPKSLFELSRPVLVNFSTESKLLSKALSSSNSSSAQDLWKSAVAPLTAMKRAKGGGVGFFEQGFLINAGLILTSTIAISSTGAWYVWRYSRG